MSDVTILYEPSGEPAADVVFVHGLNGDPIKSWRFDKPDSWHTWLPESLPEVRLLTVGYPARLQPVGSLMPIDERANNVLAHLTHENVGTRPVCFVAHGSGGLVVTELLRQSASCGVDYPQVALATGGVVFLPTPLKGFELAWSAKLVNKFALGSSSRTFGEMAPDSQKVRGLRTWLEESHQRLSIAVREFEEMSPVARLFFGETARGPGIAGVNPIRVDANYATICAPSSQNTLVFKEVQRFLLEVLSSPQSVDERGEPAPQTQGPQRHAAQPQPAQEHRDRAAAGDSGTWTEEPQSPTRSEGTGKPSTATATTGERKHFVCLLHGIRTHAAWQQVVTPILEEDTERRGSTAPLWEIRSVPLLVSGTHAQRPDTRAGRTVAPA